MKAGAGALVALLMIGGAGAAQAQEAPPASTLHACYIPDTGTVYRIMTQGTPPRCRSAGHVEFSWTDPGPAGPAGPAGDAGPTGATGLDGEPGAAGAAGVACWDLNGNGIADPEEDVNGDGFLTAADCTGPEGLPGPPGSDGPMGDRGLPGVNGAFCADNLPTASILPPWTLHAIHGRRSGTATFAVLHSTAGATPSAERIPEKYLGGGEPFLGEMMLVPYTFVPRGWAYAQGQLLQLNQHTALFALLGATYGGDGRDTFALPDTRGQEPLCMRYIIAVQGIFPPRN
jgi:hypothetical protein